MTISTETSRVNYTGNGATSVYPYTFKVFSEDDLLVTIRLISSGVETVLVKNTDYSVSGVGVSAGGNITLVNNSQVWLSGGNLLSTYAMTVRRMKDIVQETDIRNQGPFFASIHEDAFDSLVMIDQQQQDEIDRSIKLPETVSTVNATLPIPSAGLAIGWNATEDGLTNLASAGALSVSPYIETLLDDTTAAAARTTLDASQAINSMTVETAPAVGDLIGLYDISAAAERKMTLDNTLKVVNSLTAKTAPASDDYVLLYDTTAGSAKKAMVSSFGGSASGVEVLETQNELAGYGMGTRALDNSVRTSGLEVPAHTYSSSRLIEAYASGGATIKLVHNPVVIFDSDKDYDSITGWAVIGAGATLATNATAPKVGTNKFTFDKNNSAVDASIRHTLAAQTLSVGANYRVYFWVNMPSITGLSSIYLKIMGAATTDFSRWNLTTDYAGAAIAVGWNLMFVDIANTAASTTGGTVWTYTQLARYVEVGVTTSSAGQTYTAIAFDGLWFSQGDIAAFGNKYLEYTIYDTSNKNDMKIASSNTRYDGVVTLSSTVAQSYTAGISVATAAKLVRSSLSWSQAGLIGFDTSLSSGTVSLEQELRLTRVLRESLSGNYGAFVDMFIPQIYKVTTVGGSTIGVSDSEDQHLNLLNGDQVHIFTTTYSAGEPNFTLLGTRTMTANSSASGGTTTLTLTTSGIAVGDYVVKQNLTASASIVSASADESFATLSYDTAPNGAQLIGSRSYPNPNNVYAHWWLGGFSDATATVDRTGNGRSLSKVGTPNLSDTFKAGKLAATTFSTSSYLRTAGGTAQSYDGNGELIQVSGWFYFDGVNGAARRIWSAYDTSSLGAGVLFFIEVSESRLTLLHYTGGSPTSSLQTASSLVAGNWYHFVIQYQSSTTTKIFLNGVSSTTTPGAIQGIGSSGAAYIGVYQNSTTLDNTIALPGLALKYADFIVWRDGALLTQSDVNYLYNGGVPQFYGYQPCVLRNEYKLTGASGQRISMKAKLNRSTTAVSPYILGAGMIKV